jgi:hypothetical protein
MMKYFFLYILLGLAIVSTSLNFANASSKSEDLVNLNTARKLYEKNELDKAITFYDKVSKASDFWIEAVEEKAWAYTREKNYEKAIGTLKSVLNPVFLPAIGPETYVLSAFIDLKICDYKSAFDKISLFKSQMVPRVNSLEAIVANPNSEFVNGWVQKLASGKVTTADQLGNDIAKLPRFVERDTQHMTNSRMKMLAAKDLAEISKNLKKFKIIEVEVAQRSFVYEKTASQKLKFDKRKSADILVFPDEQNSGEVWLDEIGKYEVKTNKCPTAGGKS